MARRRHSAMAQALAEASLQFGPQRRDLRSSLADAGRTRQNDVRAAQISGGALAHQIRQSLGPLSQDYRLAAQVGDVANNDVLNSLKGHPGADPYAAIIQGDRALGTELSARELANAKGSLRLQANQALQGAVNDVANVRSNYQSLAGKIRSQLTGLSADQAKFIAAEVPKLRASMAADARAAQAARDTHRAAVDLHRQRTTPGLGANGKPLGAGAAKILGLSVLGSAPVQRAIRGVHVPPQPHHLPLTPAQKGSALSEINKAVATVRQFQAAAQQANKKIDYTALERHFLTGYRAQKGEIPVPAIGNAGPIPNTVLVRAALEQARTGRLSPATYAALYGVPVPPAWRPPSPRQRRRYGLGAPAASVFAAR